MENNPTKLVVDDHRDAPAWRVRGMNHGSRDAGRLLGIILNFNVVVKLKAHVPARGICAGLFFRSFRGDGGNRSARAHSFVLHIKS